MSELEAIVQKLQKANYWKLIGMEIEEVTEAGAVIKLEINDKVKQMFNQVHGGVLASLIDASIGTAIIASKSPNTSLATVQMNVNYLKPAVSGVLYAKGRVIKQGKNIIVGASEIVSSNNALIASGTGTFIVKNSTEI